MKGWICSLALVIGCSEEPLANDVCDGECIADPNMRCLDVTSCTADVDCPRGTFCGSTQRCRPVQRRGGGDPQLLSKQFGVGGMFVETEVVDGRTLVNWAAPNNETELVSCVLFSCVPTVAAEMSALRSVDVRPTLFSVSYANGSDGGRKFIDNFGKCAVFQSGISTQKMGTFDLGSPSQQVPNRLDDERCERATSTTRRLSARYSDLLAACFAYDDTGLTGVSPLFPVDPTTVTSVVTQQARTVPLSIPKDATCSDNLRPCFNSERDFFGTCFNGACERSCLRNVDCTAITVVETSEPTPIEAERPKTGTYCARNPSTPYNLGACVDFGAVEL